MKRTNIELESKEINKRSISIITTCRGIYRGEIIKKVVNPTKQTYRITFVCQRPESYGGKKKVHLWWITDSATSFGTREEIKNIQSLKNLQD